MKNRLLSGQLLCAVLGLMLCCTGLLQAQIIGPSPCIRPVTSPNCICPAVYDPVCGCNGVTYSNACFARCAGVQRWTEGPCNLCQGPPQNIYCPTIYDPVCGCDGNTYSNSCFATAAGILIWTPGACGYKRANEVAAPTTLSPNPTNGIAVLKWTPTMDGNATVTVTDMVGKVVIQSGAIMEAEGGMSTYPIDAAGRQSGLYIVRLSSGGIVTTQKLMVTR